MVSTRHMKYDGGGAVMLEEGQEVSGEGHA